LKVLVIQIATIGDFLLATPALRALKLVDKTARVELLTGRSLQAVARDNPCLDQIFYLNDRRTGPGGFLGKTAEAVKILWLLRREKIDLGFNFQRDRRFNIILFLVGCKRRIGFARGRRSLWLTDPLRIDRDKHQVFQYCDLLKKTGIFCLDFKMEFPVSEAVLAAVNEKFLKPECLEDGVVLAPGGAEAAGGDAQSRCWPSENFAALAGLLIQDGQRVLLLGGKDDIRIAASIRAAQPKVVDWIGKTTLAETAALMKKARLVIGSDSGLMQLAAAVGARIIVIFGPSHPGERKPLTAGNVAVWKGENMECSPCCRDGEFPSCDQVMCLKSITPQEIFDLITK